MKSSIFYLALALATLVTAATPTQATADESAPVSATSSALEQNPAATPSSANPAAPAGISPLAPASAGLPTAASANPVAPASANPIAPADARAADPSPPGLPVAKAVPLVPVNPVRLRYKRAGVVLLSLAGAALVGFFGGLIYNSVANPDEQSLPAGARLGFGLSAVAFGITGSALLGYSLAAPARPAVAAALLPVGVKRTDLGIGTVLLLPGQ